MSKKRSQINVLLVYVVTMIICLAVFGSCAILLLDIFVTQPAKKKAELQAAKEQAEEQAPEEADYSYANETILFVGASGDDINAMALIRVLPQEEHVLVVPISKYTVSDVGGTSGSILGLYQTGGLTYLKASVEKAFGVHCDKYIKITDDGWKQLVEYAGGTSTYTFPEDMYYKNEETGELTIFSAGVATRTLWGDDIRRILTYPLYSEGEKTKVRAVGEMSVCLINSAFLTKGEELKNNLNNIFNTIYNNSDTDITSKSFKDVQSAYEHLLSSTVSPATYRMPKGSWNVNGYFTLDNDFKTEIKEYFELS